MTKKKTTSRSGGVNIRGSAKAGGGVYQSDKIDKIDSRQTTINRSGGTDITSGDGSINITGDSANARAESKFFSAALDCP
ncbi:MAG TPA: hypothetical protein VJG32_21170 [Anaerolineae bacterium]|nr:hypothetical protein [Anaerolineae bacterium]